MSDYSKSTNFTAKDTLPTGNAGKIIKGTEFDIEFTNIASAISSKADVSSPSLLGSPTAPTATAGSNTNQLANTAYVKTAFDNFSSSGNAATVTNGVYTTGNQTIAGNKTFTGTTTVSGTSSLTGQTFASSLFAGGTTTSTTMAFQSNSINFYDADTGNGFTSIAFGSASSALADQAYQFGYNNAGSSAVAYNFFGDGTAQKTGGGSWASISDSRLKENVTPLTGALAKISALKPVSYTWKIPKDNEPTVGFIAQEVQAIIPNAVTSHKPTEEEAQFISDKTLAIGWQADMTAYLVAAIQELKAELDVANAKITALQNA